MLESRRLFAPGLSVAGRSEARQERRSLHVGGDAEVCEELSGVGVDNEHDVGGLGGRRGGAGAATPHVVVPRVALLGCQRISVRFGVDGRVRRSVRGRLRRVRGRLRFFFLSRSSGAAREDHARLFFAEEKAPVMALAKEEKAMILFRRQHGRSGRHVGGVPRRVRDADLVTEERHAEECLADLPEPRVAVAEMRLVPRVGIGDFGTEAFI